ncbi:MAG: M48 family metalloprotease [Chloroflexi bacterium]|nr:M48 family metalloprotease [Chloroflexota bacterium]
MWEQIRDNQIRSVLLVTTMGILLLLVGFFIGFYLFGDPVSGIIIAILIWGIMNLVALFQGDSIILGMSGAKKIGPDDHPRLYNVVEEMKIASGLPKMPDIYIMDDPALNAFSTGRDPDHASVAITSGLLDKLNRDELQGVIGHEMGHVANRDIRLMMLASILLGSIVMLAWYATRISFFGGMMGGRRSSSGGGGGIVTIIIVVIGLLLMILAPIMAQLIYFAVSRSREYLADASSAKYTRYPEGLASALEKLENNDTKVRTANKATAPMYISNPFYKGTSAGNDLMATHPPLTERIRILRAMSGASYTDYEASYKAVKNESVIPASALAGASTMALRQASAGAQAGEVNEQIDRARETSDALWRLNNYRSLTCANCGAGMRLPPKYDQPEVKCPHCGYVNQL